MRILTWIRDRIADAWRYSRIIFINAATAIGLGLNELISYLLAADWSSVINNPRALFIILLVINLANIYLRTQTTCLPGRKDD